MINKTLHVKLISIQMLKLRHLYNCKRNGSIACLCVSNIEACGCYWICVHITKTTLMETILLILHVISLNNTKVLFLSVIISDDN